MNATVPSMRPKAKRRWYQFGLRRLLVATAGCAAALAFWTSYIRPYRAQQPVIAMLTEAGVKVVTEPAGPVWLRKLVGEDYFVKATELHLRRPELLLPASADAALEVTKQLTSLKFLNLEQTDVTDAGLVHVRCLSNLQRLDLSGTRITDAGLEHLKPLRNLQELDLGGISSSLTQGSNT